MAIGIEGAGTEFLVNEIGIGFQSNPRVASLSDGTMLMTWNSSDSDAGDIKGRLFFANGQPKSPEFLINGLTSSSQQGPSVTAIGNDRFAVIWYSTDSAQDGAGYAVKGQIVGSDGTKIGGEFLVDQNLHGYEWQPRVVSLSNGNFAAIWVSSSIPGPAPGQPSSLQGQIFNSSGDKIGGQFEAAGENVYTVFPGASALANGGMVVAWRSEIPGGDSNGSGIFAQRLSASGAKVGAVIPVNSEIVGNQSTNTVTGLGDGRFVVAWSTEDPSQDGNGFAIKAQIFSASGAKIGGEFLVNTLTDGNQTVPIVIAVGATEFAIGWSGPDPVDGSGTATKMQLFDSNGGKIGDEFLVNQQGFANQASVNYAWIGSSNTLMTVWRTDDPAQDGANSAVKARMLTIGGPAGAPIAQNINLAVDEDTAILIDWHSVASDPNGDPLSIDRIDNIDVGLFDAVSLSGGELTLSDPDLTFEPDADFSGTVSFLYRITDGLNGATARITINVRAVNDAPVITSNAYAEAAVLATSSGSPFSTVILAEDVEGDALSYAISGADATRFTIDPASGLLTFAQGAFAPDASVPQDANGDNLYQVDVTVSDGEDTDVQHLTVSVQRGTFEAVTTSNPVDTIASPSRLAHPNIAALTGGEHVLTWSEQDGGFGTIKAQLFDAANNPITGEFLVSLSADEDAYDPAVVALTDGRFVIAWNSFDNSSIVDDEDTGYAIKSQMFERDGRTIGDVQVANNGGYPGWDDTEKPALSALPDGGYMLSWADRGIGASDRGIAALGYNPVGQSLPQAAFVVNQESRYDQYDVASVALSDGKVMFVWRQQDYDGNSELYVRLFDHTSPTQWTPISGDKRIAQFSNILGVASITSLSGGNVLVAYAGGEHSETGVSADGSDSAIIGILLDGEGNIARTMVLNQDVAGPQTAPAVMGMADGGFVASWVGADGSIRLAAFDDQGTARGGEQVVADALGTRNAQPRLAMLASGEIVVSWQTIPVGANEGDYVISERIFSFATTSSQISGTVIDGYISGATVFVDLNGNGIVDAGEPMAVTGPDGSFVLDSSSPGRIVAYGGTNIDTGLPNTLTYYAGVGATTVSPLTTLLSVLADQTGNLPQAQDRIKDAFGIAPSVDLATFDPFAVGVDADLALSVQKAAVGVASLLEAVVANPTAAPGAQDEALSGIAATVATSNGALDLSNSGVIAGVLANALPDVDADAVAQLAAIEAAKQEAIDAAASLGDIVAVQTNQGPEGNPGALTRTATEDAEFHLFPEDLLAGIVDPDGDAMHVVALAVSGASIVDDGFGGWLLQPARDFAGTLTLSYTVLDGQGGSLPLTRGLTVAGVNDAPMINSYGSSAVAELSLVEGRSAAAMIGVSDVDGPSLRFEIVDGTDAQLFGVDAQTGAVFFLTAPIFAQPADSDGDNVYEVSVQASDGQAQALQTLRITIVPSHGEVQTGDDNADILTGGAYGDTLIGLGGNDTLRGLDGDDLLNGGLGDDVVDGGAGVDAASFSGAVKGVKVSLTLAVAQNTGGYGKDTLISIENLTGSSFNDKLTGNGDANTLDGGLGNDKLYGGDGADHLIGGVGNDTLDGGTGADIMEGGAGNDKFYVDDAGDRVIEAADEGTDWVYARVDYVLTENVEKLTLTGSANLNGTGNALNNTIVGNDGDNVLNGSWGKDILTGGLGADTFVFDVLETTKNKDTIKDFVHGLDHIELSVAAFSALAGYDLGVLDPGELTFGKAATTASQHLIYNSANGGLYYDADGVGGAAQVQIAVLTGKPLIDASDIVLI